MNDCRNESQKRLPSSNAPRVLMFGPSLDSTGGISNVVSNWLEAGLDKKIYFKYIPTVEQYVSNHRRIVKKFLKAASAAIQLIRTDRNKFDIAHIHFSTAMSFYRKLIIFKIASLKGWKILIHLHAGSFQEFYENSGKTRKRLIENFFSHSDLVLVLSNAWFNYCLQLCPKDKLKILYNGASTSKFCKKLTNRSFLNITCMGLLSPKKGTYDLIEAFARLAVDNQKVRLVLGGDGEIEQVKALAKKLNLEERIDVLGWVSGYRKIEVFEKSDIYALPSYSEGMPGSILEAMAAGNPIISTPVGGIPELVINNCNGYLIVPGDVDALYSKLKYLVKNEAIREKMAKESIEIIENKFEISSLVEELIYFYESLLTDKIANQQSKARAGQNAASTGFNQTRRFTGKGCLIESAEKFRPAPTE